MKPSDYLFCMDYSDEEVVFCFTSKEYWDEYQTLDDCLGSIKCLPPKFHNTAEACWGYLGTVEQGKNALLEAGFIYSPDMDILINE